MDWKTRIRRYGKLRYREWAIQEVVDIESKRYREWKTQGVGNTGGRGGEEAHGARNKGSRRYRK